MPRKNRVDPWIRVFETSERGYDMGDSRRHRAGHTTIDAGLSAGVSRVPFECAPVRAPACSCTRLEDMRDRCSQRAVASEFSAQQAKTGECRFGRRNLTPLSRRGS